MVKNMDENNNRSKIEVKFNLVGILVIMFTTLVFIYILKLILNL